MSRRRHTLIALGTTPTLAVTGATVFVTTSAFADSGCDSVFHISHRDGKVVVMHDTDLARTHLSDFSQAAETESYIREDFTGTVSFAQPGQCYEL